MSEREQLQALVAQPTLDPNDVQWIRHLAYEVLRTGEVMAEAMDALNKNFINLSELVLQLMHTHEVELAAKAKLEEDLAARPTQEQLDQLNQAIAALGLAVTEHLKTQRHGVLPKVLPSPVRGLDTAKSA